MPDIQNWIRLYSSQNRQVKIRAANGMLLRADEVPLELMVDILETLSRGGFGAKVQRALLKRRDPGIVARMLGLLASKNDFTREVACSILGHSKDRAATTHLLRMVDDANVMVRRAASFALAFFGDPSALPELRRLLKSHASDDQDVVVALECALRTLGGAPS